MDQLNNNSSESKVASNDNNPQSKLVKDIMSRQVEQEAIARGGAKTNEVRRERSCHVVMMMISTPCDDDHDHDDVIMIMMM